MKDKDKLTLKDRINKIIESIPMFFKVITTAILSYLSAGIFICALFLVALIFETDSMISIIAMAISAYLLVKISFEILVFGLNIVFNNKSKKREIKYKGSADKNQTTYRPYPNTSSYRPGNYSGRNMASLIQEAARHDYYESIKQWNREHNSYYEDMIREEYRRRERADEEYRQFLWEEDQRAWEARQRDYYQ